MEAGIGCDSRCPPFLLISHIGVVYGQSRFETAGPTADLKAGRSIAPSQVQVAMPAPKIHIRKRNGKLEIETAAPVEARILKLDSDRQVVFGWANVCVECDGETIVDSHDDTIDPEELETAAYNFALNNGGMGEDHEGVTKGRLIESMFFTPEKLELMGLKKSALHTGWWIGFYVEDETAWENVKKGKHKMFSIQGVGKREEVK